MAKMTVDFNTEVTEMLHGLAEREGRTNVEILRRAIGLYKYFTNKRRENPDSYLAILREDGTVIREIYMI